MRVCPPPVRVAGLGALFRSKSLSKTKRDLLIFLTPTIVHGDSETGYEKYYQGLPEQQTYTNDKWQPDDNAKPRALKPLRLFNPIAKDPPPNTAIVPAAPGSTGATSAPAGALPPTP